MSETTPAVEVNPEGLKDVHMRESFHRFAHGAAELAGSAFMFLSAVVIVALWALVGPYFRYSDSWQLVINTATTIITFLMVFLIQNTQNRDAREIHLKLDELIRSNAQARNQFISLEKLSDHELQLLAERLLKKAQK
jgi:low affinity Fe/Cu permease